VPEVLHVDFDAILEMLKRLGFTSKHYREYFAKHRSDVEQAYVNVAKETIERDGEVEIDDDAEVSMYGDPPEDGAYVQGWVWVSRTAREEEE